MSVPINELITRFQKELDATTKKGHPEPTAMTLSTVSEAGAPTSRVVLLKAFDHRGFVFYTNLTSRKSKEISLNPQVCINFMWHNISKQIRIEGRAQQVSNEEADAYFATRAKQSQIGAWASKQSSEIEGKMDFEKRIAKYTLKFAASKVPRPEFWSGFRIVPTKFEFWQKRDFRLHERHVFTPTDEQNWQEVCLYP
ncbi:pyridoxamine 5'-phosphate oxidase [Lentisphaera profundi]|uniref:Pyridoxamine 5'-phosphate oxidase n=1 Tax=Lentisphaera profundi TaxID=1658616 RepID=A0ABY7VWV7_9BACT|nr:pyridoxamine 5'-phosphate oxidase [Lentisphaera profundi]WDE98736.1 pyridoxamine 5'-phosphate oxidase [Lentisphaera profundi]